MRPFARLFCRFTCASMLFWASAIPIGHAGDPGNGRAFTVPFQEVNARRSSPHFQSYVDAALQLLKDHPTKIGRLTYESIQGGSILIDEVCDLTSWDFWRVRRSLMRWGVNLSKDDYFKLRRPESGITRKIESVIDAYMWGNRIYLSGGLDDEMLAATLVHEVNHVLNDVDRDYYDNWPVNAFLHEYRAFYAERLFNPSIYLGIDLVEHVIRIYGFERDSIPESVLKQPLRGLLYPTEDAWELRDVESDPVEDRWMSPVYG